MKNIVILGSTGSIGTQTLNVIRRNRDKFNVVALAARENVEKIAEQANEFHPKYVGLTDERACSNLKLNYNCVKSSGKNVLKDFASLPEADIVVCAVVGMSGFDGVISAINNHKEVALANKEVLVSGGEYITSLAKKNNVRILPVDSEHSAVWQCLEGKNKSDVKEIILTASGGPFREVSCVDEFKNITVEEAVSHPNWKMGKKISVDSATMMNKGLELIEARWLFDNDNVDYVIHPQSIIHSFVRFIDGSMLAQISNPDMELPIQIALGFPDRIPCEKYDFMFNKKLEFFKPKEDIFILPKIAKLCMKIGKSAPCVLNAANEAAVQLFLEKKIGFLDIQRIVENVISSSNFVTIDSYEDIIAVNNQTMQEVYGDFGNYIKEF